MTAGRFAAPAKNVRRRDRSRDIDAEVRPVSVREKSVIAECEESAARLIRARFRDSSDTRTDLLLMLGLSS